MSKEAVLDQARLKTGVNIFSVNVALAEKRLRFHPWIASVQIQRRLPDTMTVRVTEHRPVAVIDLGGKFLLNDHGEIFKEVEGSDPKDLPMVTGLQISDILNRNETKSMPFHAVLDVLHFSTAPDSILPVRMIHTIRVDKDMGIVLKLKPVSEFFEIKEVKLGYHNTPAKYRLFKELMGHLKQEYEALRIDSVDLNDLERVVISPHQNGISLTGVKEDI